MKKIVILTDQICKIGGITSLIYLKANYWVTQDHHEVHVITTEQEGKKPYYPMNSEVQLHDLDVNYHRYSSYFSPKNLIKIFKNLFRLQSKLRKIKPDIIIVANHIPVTFFFPLLITKAKILKEFHFSKFYLSRRKKTLFRRFESYLESKFDFLVVLNPEERAFYQYDNVVTISNPIQVDREIEPVYTDRKKIAMAAGRISGVKRFDVLIDIWAQFIEKEKDWKLEIYGDGEKEDVDFLKQKIESLKLSDYVEIKGSTNTIQDKMRSYGLYLMTSAAECFPMVLLEAQSCGLPIISYDCPTGPRNIISHNQNGVLVEMDNQELFVEELMDMTTNESRKIQLAKNGFVNAKKYTLDAIMTIWDHEIINKKEIR